MLHLSLANFSQKKREAVLDATVITNQIAARLDNKEVIDLEKITGTEKLGDQGKEILHEFVGLINSPLVTGSEMLANALLGGLGANLTALIHEGQKIVHGIHEWIETFETIFHLHKNAKAQEKAE